MSMEQSIDKLADAILALAKAMGAPQPQSGASDPVMTATEVLARSKEYVEDYAAKKAERKSQAAETPPAKETTPAAAEPAAETTGAVDQAQPQTEAQRGHDYERDVKPLFIKLIQKRGRDAGKALIAEYNPDAAKLPEAITAEQYGDVIARINELLED